MSDQIRKILEDRIVAGILKPGDRLLELEIAREFNTSQTPVREALEALNSQRLVESIAYRGTYVRGISNQEMQEAYAVRGVLEQLAAEISAPYFEQKIDTLREIQEALYVAARNGDTNGYAHQNDRFHRAIVEAANNSLLLDAWAALDFENRVRILMVKHFDPNLSDRAAEHEPVIEALSRGDGQAAGQHLRHHSHLCAQRWQARSEAGLLQDQQGDGDHVPAGVLS